MKAYLSKWYYFRKRAFYYKLYGNAWGEHVFWLFDLEYKEHMKNE